MQAMRAALAATSILLLAGCSSSNSYTPPAGAIAAKIYVDACSGCHKSVKQFELTTSKATVDDVTNKVTQGSAAMPAFPNITGESLSGLAHYVVENSARK